MIQFNLEKSSRKVIVVVSRLERLEFELKKKIRKFAHSKVVFIKLEYLRIKFIFLLVVDLEGQSIKVKIL